MHVHTIESGCSVAYRVRGWEEGRRLVVQNRDGMLLFMNEGGALFFFAQRFDMATLSVEALGRRMRAVGTGPADPPTEIIELESPDSIALQTPEVGPEVSAFLSISSIGIALGGGMGIICAVHGDPVDTRISGIPPG